MKKPKGRQEVTDLIVSLIILGIVIAYYLFLIFGGHWFGATSDFYLALNLFSGVGNPNPWIRILSYALFLLSVSYIGRIVLLFIGMCDFAILFSVFFTLILIFVRMEKFNRFSRPDYSINFFIFSITMNENSVNESTFVCSLENQTNFLNYTMKYF